jgi:hypothetical protein
MNCYWVRCGNNYGDVLTSYIVKEKYGIITQWTPALDAHFVAVGSLLELLPQHYSGVVLGSGSMWKDSVIQLPKATIKLLRGKLTAKKLGVVAPLGDPGIIASDFIVRQTKRHSIGVIPHYVDKTLRNEYPDGHFISVLTSPKKFIEEVDQCDLVITSSLHALITADSLGIPRMWVPHNKVLGDGFKFYDYSSSLNLNIVERVFEVAPSKTVEGMKKRVRESFDEVFE